MIETTKSKILPGTTPTFKFRIPCKGSEIDKIRLAYSQFDKIVFVKTEPDFTIEDDSISITLTQEETFMFDDEMFIEIQLRVLTKAGIAWGSEPKRIDSIRCFEDGVII